MPLGRVRDGGNAKTRIHIHCCRLGADGASSLPPAEKVLPRVVQGLRGAQGLIFSAQGLLAPRILLQVCRSVRAPLGSTFLPLSMHDLPRTDARASAVASSARRFPSHNPSPTPFRLESAVPPQLSRCVRRCRRLGARLWPSQGSCSILGVRNTGWGHGKHQKHCVSGAHSETLETHT